MEDLENIAQIGHEHLFAELSTIARSNGVEFTPTSDIIDNIRDLYFLLKFYHIPLNDVLEDTIFIDYLNPDITLRIDPVYDEIAWYLYHYRDRLNIFLKMAFDLDPNFWQTENNKHTRLFNKFFIDRNVGIVYDEEENDYIPMRLEVVRGTRPSDIMDDIQYMISGLSPMQQVEFALYSDHNSFFLRHVSLNDFVGLVK